MKIINEIEKGVKETPEKYPHFHIYNSMFLNVATLQLEGSL